MKKNVIINSAASAQLPDTAEVGKPITIQLAPAGEYPQFVDDGVDVDGKPLQKEVVQILDDKAMQTLVANFEKEKAEAEAKGQRYGVLVDADHSSETSTNTAAMGWVTKLYIDPDKGLMAEIDPTSLGAEKINGKVYRFVSGAWTLDDDNRPETLVSIGLTNKPNLPVAPMINAAKTTPDNKDDAGSAGNAEPVAVTHDNPDDGGVEKPTGENAEVQTAEDSAQHDNSESTKGAINMDLKEKLGLPPEATDAEVDGAIDALIARCSAMEQVRNALGMDETAANEEIVEAVNAVVNQCGELQAKNEEAEKAQLNAEAEEFVKENEEVIPEDMTDEIKEEYVEDKEKAEATVANFRKVHERAILNAAKGATKKAEEPKKPALNWREAKKPALNFSEALAAADGDPEKENEIIKNMCVKR